MCTITVSYNFAKINTFTYLANLLHCILSWVVYAEEDEKLKLIEKVN